MNNILSLRAQSGGEGWTLASAFDIQAIDAIDDGQGGDTEQQPTSIPSPFARIELHRSAFRDLNNGKHYPNSERLVSKMLDLGELLFNYEDVKSKLKIDKWEIKGNEGPTDWIATKQLQKSGSIGHKRLGKVLEMFLKQDASTYNFGVLPYLHIISYDNYVIGGTSPVTMFFSTPNEQYFDKIEIRFGTHKLFDKSRNYVPLYERDIEYQNIWYYLYTTNKLTKHFKGLEEYVGNCIEYVKEHRREEVYDFLFGKNGKCNETYIKENYSLLDAGSQNQGIDVLGVPFYKKKSVLGGKSIARASKFLISTSKYKGELIPMALQTKFSKPLSYIDTMLWPSSAEVPTYVAESWQKNERTLPTLTQKYPWLTTNDLLEPYLVKFNHGVNKQTFFFGTEEGIASSEAYLPPIRKDFFLFFNVKDLVEGRVIYKITNIGDGEIKVTIGIPINDNLDHIIFEREYLPIPQGLANYGLPKPALSLNQGYIVDVPFNTIIYPPIRSGNVHVNPNYSVQLTSEKNTLIEDISLEFLKEDLDKPVVLKEFPSGLNFKYRSDPGSIFTVTTKYYRVVDEFDLIAVQLKNAENKIDISACIIPKFIRYNGGTDAYVVAIDFGTTNSHIEIAVVDIAVSEDKEEQLTTPRSLQIQDAQLLSIAELSKKVNPIDLYLSYLYEFIPDKIDKEYAFPIRTVISEASRVEHKDQDLSLFADFNIPFYYEKETKRKPDKLHTNLKWAKTGEASYNHTYFFLEELILLIKNKLLLDGADLNKTKVIWTYPSSMSPPQQSRLTKIWKEIIAKHISRTSAEPSSGLLVAVKESIAPFYHYKRINPNLLSGRRPVVAIDIGGGTTDTVVYYRNIPEILTSFRFAGNAVFGDGLREEASQSNGFVLRYKQHFIDLLTKNKLGDLKSYNEDVIKTGNSENIVSFWFSIEKHPDVQNKNLFSFNNSLSDDGDMKIVFLLFYTAILYHIIKMMKERKYPMPNGLIFSGTGSKMLQIITDNDKLLRQFSKAVIEQIYEEDYDGTTQFSVFCDMETPKEATSKGMLSMKAKDFENDPANVIYTGLTARPFDVLTYQEANDDNLVNEIVAEVQAFYTFFFALSKKFGFESNFAVSPQAIKIAKEVLPYSLDEYLAEAINQKSIGLTDLDTELEDTLFFYPIMGALNNLAYELHSKTSK